MYSVFNSNITTHLDSFRQMKLALLINSANKNTYSFVSHITVSIILVKYGLPLRDDYGQAISVTKLKEVKNEHLQADSCPISSSGQGRPAMEMEQRDKTWRHTPGRRYSGSPWELCWRPSDARKESPDFRWDLTVTLVHSFLLHETTFYL